MDNNSILGAPLDRVDGPLKVTGRAKYAYEHNVPDAVYGALVVSPIASGTITSIDMSRAEKAPGVLLVMSHENAPRLAKQKDSSKAPGPGEAWQALQDNVVYYAYQPVAVVVAKTSTQARSAAKLVDIKYDARQPQTDLESRLQEAYAPAKAGGGGDPAASKRGDVDAGLAQSERHIEQVYYTPFEFHNPMEPHATIALWTAPDQLTIYDATQGVFGDRQRLASALGLQPDQVRVISPFLGGGFGSKGPTWSHVVIAALAARQVKRPVKLQVARPQMFNMVGLRSETRQQIAIGARSDGGMTALRNDCVSQTSAFGEFVEAATLPSRMLYACANNSTSQRLLHSNIGQTSYMRAPGEATGTFALEVAIDEMAQELGMDPIEFRLKNYAETDPDKGKPWSSKSLRECYRQGADRFGWNKRNPKPASMRVGDKLVGYGMASAVYPTRRSAAQATATLHSDGTLHVDAGTQDIGTGTYTIMTQIAADAFGAKPHQVIFRLGDTVLPQTPVSGGSQTAASTGSAVYLATEALKEKLIQMAISDPGSPVSGMSAQDVTLANGRIISKGGKGEALRDLLARSGQSQVQGKADAKPGPEKEEYAMYAFGAQFAEVHVDADLGEVTVARMTGCFGAGKILNAKTARSQLLGGMIWGISMALYEEAQLDKRLGRWVNNNLAEYHVPTNLDVRELEAIWVDEVDHHINPIGAKGIGEIGITGAAAAVANAVSHATGKRFRTLPITLDKVIA
jgi:xanthine dehydrogenase YagR molybdenum-binding subunit